MTRESIWSRIGRHVFLVIFSLFLMIPVLWTIATSFKVRDQIYAYPPRIIPDILTVTNYERAFDAQPLFRYMFNSFLVASLTVVVGLIVAVSAAFSFSRLRFPAKKTVIGAVLFTIMMPGLTNLIPLYRIFSNLRLVDTYQGLVLLYLPGILAFSIFVLTNFFNQVPRSLEEAALIDGCSIYQIILRVFVPVSTSAIFAVMIINFVNRWNEFLIALVFTSRKLMRTLPTGIYYFTGFSYIDYGALSAAAVVAIVLPVTLFLLMKDHFVAALMEGSIKG